MMILAFLVVAATLGVMASQSRRAMQRFARHERLPMQWGLDGRPTWYAPRLVALFFAPVLAALCLAIPLTLLAFLAVDIAAPAEGRRTTLGVIAVMGFAWVAAHAGYLWGLGKWDRALSR